MKRILFVDDDQNILDGLENVLYRQRKRWQMVFALGGQAALEELRKGQFHVVVSDMRMPGIDGARLLEYAKELQPSAARFILSGYGDREAVVRALPVAHQFLSKPCDSEILRIVVDRACELQTLLASEEIRAIVGSLDRLPSAPSTYFDLTTAMACADLGAKDVAEIVERDPAMAVKVLQLVNSSYFGVARQLTSIHQAVAYLGTEFLKALALSAHVFATLSPKPIRGFDIEETQQHSIETARVAQAISPDGKRSDAFIAGLVHDVGRLVFAVGDPERCSKIGQTVASTARRFHEVEQEVLGVSHAEVGAYLLGVWGLPIPVVEAVAFHHRPSAVFEGDVDLLAAVHIADAVVRSLGLGAGLPDHGVDPDFVDGRALRPMLDAAVASAKAIHSGRALRP
ncbi:MAG: HDOD domain-containing protein [Deltaproteobacteria bacterium]|nr:HDOD domain-containing protein [Deltaproteobacteria bacterium]